MLRIQFQQGDNTKLRFSPMNVYIWGKNSRGLLGLGDKSGDRLEPTLLEPNTRKKLEWMHIECGYDYTVGITKNGKVYAWGDDGWGQLGHTDRRKPKKVKALRGIVIIKVSCGQGHTAALTNKGETLTWGRGQLGHGTYYDDQLTPKKVEALAKEVIVDVVCGQQHTCAVTSTGSMFTWGKGIATGHDEYDVLTPKLLLDLSSKGVVSVSASGSHTACVTKDGELFTWGYGEYGKLGHGDESDQDTPKRVEALVGVKVTMVCCGYGHTAVCTEDGHVYTFGLGEEGQLGHGDKENKSSPVLVQALVGKHITQVQCGGAGGYTMALTSSGFVFTWGSAQFGVLGHGNVKSFFFPCLVEGLREHNVVQISSGYDHCAVLVDPTSHSGIRQSQQASLNNQEHSDVVFKVENEPLYGIVSVLTQKSDYFEGMFRSNMRENIERVVNVPNCSKEKFLQVLEYLCLDDFTVSIDDAVELWVLADYYQMEGLKYCCMSALERGLTDEHASQILKEVRDLGSPCYWLERICHDYEHMRSELYLQIFGEDSMDDEDY
jgi:alpha-tubulin suppressor-like RCC1 family protein